VTGLGYLSHDANGGIQSEAARLSATADSRSDDNTEYGVVHRLVVVLAVVALVAIIALALHYRKRVVTLETAISRVRYTCPQVL